MPTLTNYILGGLDFGEKAMNSPVFTFQGTDYVCVPSISLFKRELEDGGFSTVKMLTLSTQAVDTSGNDVFAALPQPQQILSYLGEQYRIESVKRDPNLSYIRIIAHNTTQGI
jgi:hypothetical protein